MSKTTENGTTAADQAAETTLAGTKTTGMAGRAGTLTTIAAGAIALIVGLLIGLTIAKR
jgi:hypothetical protein